MKTRKWIAVTCLILLCATFAVAGGQGEGRRESVVMGTSGIGGSWYPVASTIAGVVMKHTDTVVTVQASGGSTENLRLMQSGEYGMGMVNSAMMYYAYHGTETFEGATYKDLRVVVNLFPAVIQCLVMKNSPIQSYADLKGRKFSPGSPGSGDEIAYTEILSVYGLGRNDTDWRPLTHSERVMSFKDLVLDAAGYFTSVPSGSVLEVCALSEIRLLPISDKKEEFFTKYPYYFPWTVPANTYKGQTTDVETIAAGSLICADARVSEELVYNFLKGMFTELEPIQQVHGMTKYITAETALSGIGDVPVHPGAIRYYKEVGLLK